MGIVGTGCVVDGVEWVVVVGVGAGACVVLVAGLCVAGAGAVWAGACAVVFGFVALLCGLCLRGAVFLACFAGA